MGSSGYRTRRARPPGGCTCFLHDDEAREPTKTSYGGGTCDALAAEAIGMLSPDEKDKIILQMHRKIRQLTDREQEVISFSEGTVASLERTHEDVVHRHAAFEHRLQEEVHQWQHQHPKVAELQEEVARLRGECDRSKREHVITLRKLVRIRSSPGLHDRGRTSMTQQGGVEGGKAARGRGVRRGEERANGNKNGGW